MLLWQTGFPLQCECIHKTIGKFMYRHLYHFHCTSLQMYKCNFYWIIIFVLSLMILSVANGNCARQYVHTHTRTHWYCCSNLCFFHLISFHFQWKYTWYTHFGLLFYSLIFNHIRFFHRIIWRKHLIYNGLFDWNSII